MRLLIPSSVPAPSISWVSSLEMNTFSAEPRSSRRSTACRVELRVDEHVSNDDVLMAIPLETRATFPRLAMRGGDEDPTTRVVYLGSDDWMQ